MRATSAALSFTVHVALVLAAVRATARGAAPRRPIFIVESSWAPPTSKREPSAPPVAPVVRDGDLPALPPLPFPLDGDVGRALRDTSTWRWPGATDAPPGAWPSEAGEPLEAALADDPPVLLAGPVAAYPELLRQAGLEGRVVLEAVIDTTGRVEPGSIAVMAATNPGFVDAARRALAGALFRPARVHGRAVRVRIRLPTEFVLRRHR